MRILLDYFEAGDSLEVFLDYFPHVSREQAIAAELKAVDLKMAENDRLIRGFCEELGIEVPL
jgi:uncharacterized protein (DUF433 family)